MKRRGDRLSISARVYNKTVTFFQENPEPLRAPGSPIDNELETFDGLRVRFANDTEEELPPGSIVRLADPFPLPEDDVELFRASPILKAQKPATGDGTNRTTTVGVVVRGCSDVDMEGGEAVVEGLAIVRIKAGSSPAANAAPKLVAVIDDDPSACEVTDDPEKAFAVVVKSQEIDGGSEDPTYALVYLGACTINRIAVKNTDDHPLGLYVHYDCEADDVWHLVNLGAACPSSGSSGGGDLFMMGGGDSSGGESSGGSSGSYEPGGTWSSGPPDGYSAAWYSPDCEPPAGEGWDYLPIIVGETTYCAWRRLSDDSIAYGGGYTP